MSESCSYEHAASILTVKEGNVGEDNKGRRNATRRFYLYLEMKEAHMVPCM